MDYAKSTIADVPDFPKPGIVFKDITPMLADAKAFDEVIQTLADRYRGQGITHFAGIESRGFIFAAPLAKALGAGLVLIRKPGKLPRETFSESYELEYGTDTLEIHKDATQAGDQVVILDDLIATGGTAAAAVALVKQTGAQVKELSVVIELTFLNGRDKLGDTACHALIEY